MKKLNQTNVVLDSCSKKINNHFKKCVINNIDTNVATVRTKTCIPVLGKDCCFYSFNGLADGKEHIALVFDKKSLHSRAPLVRVHSECLTGDVFGSGKCDCGEQLDEAIHRFSQFGGILIYLRQEGRGIGLYNKLDAYALQCQGYDTFEANNILNFKDDLRDYKVAAQMLKALGVNRIKLLSNNPDKPKQLSRYGIEIDNTVSTGVHVKQSNLHYLMAKKVKSGHNLNLNNCA